MGLQNRRKTVVYLHLFVTASSIFLTYSVRKDWFFTPGDHKTWHEVQTVELNVSLQAVLPLGDYVFFCLVDPCLFTLVERAGFKASNKKVCECVYVCVCVHACVPVCLSFCILLCIHKDKGHIHRILKYQEHANNHNQWVSLFFF